MRRFFSFRYALLLSIILFSIKAYGYVHEYLIPNQEGEIYSMLEEQLTEAWQIDPINRENGISNEDLELVDSASDSSDTNPLHNYKDLNVLGTKISLGESAESILNKLGKPSRISMSELAFDCYVYNNDYNKLLFVAILDNEVVGYYTDSIDFNYIGITSGSSLDKVGQSLNMDLTLDSVLTHTIDTYNLHIFMDEIGTQKVTGISLHATDLKLNRYNTEIMRDIELLVYDLTNSIRKRNGIPILSWSSTAAKAARKHSMDMAVNGYFNHYNQYNKSPGDRLKDEGIFFQTVSENIIAGYGTAIISSHAWFNSPEHRNNILNKDYRNLGVGFTYQEDSIFKTYITQNFYR